jgi:hypothetical protein
MDVPFLRAVSVARVGAYVETSDHLHRRQGDSSLLHRHRNAVDPVFDRHRVSASASGSWRAALARLRFVDVGTRMSSDVATTNVALRTSRRRMSGCCASGRDVKVPPLPSRKRVAGGSTRRFTWQMRNSR